MAEKIHLEKRKEYMVDKEEEYIMQKKIWLNNIWLSGSMKKKEYLAEEYVAEWIWFKRRKEQMVEEYMEN